MQSLDKGLWFPLESYGVPHSISAEMDLIIDIKQDCEMEETEWFSNGGWDDRKNEEDGKWERCKTMKDTGEKRERAW